MAMRPSHSKKLKRFVWDTSTIVNIKEPDDKGYSPGHSLMKDLSDGWIEGPYQSISPSIAAFEVSASVSRMHREGKKILREFFIVDEYSVLYPIDQKLITRSAPVVRMDGFRELRGADLIFACIAYLENAFLVTLDNGYQSVSDSIRIINLNESRESPRCRLLFK